MEYVDLPKLWHQLSAFTWEEIEDNIWEDFQLARTEIEFNALYDNRQAGDILLSPSKINFNTTLTYVVSGKNYREILDLFPDYYRNDPLKNTWLECLGRYFNSLDFNYNFYTTQIIVDRSTQFLHLFANDLGVLSIPTLSYIQRRNRILAKAYINQPFTPKNLEKVLEFLGLTGLTYKEETEKYLISIYPNSLENNENLELLNKIIQIWKPAHINTGIAVARLVWQDIEPYTWAEMISYVWGEL